MGAMRGQGGTRGQSGGNEGAVWWQRGGKVEVTRGQCGGKEGARWK